MTVPILVTGGTGTLGRRVVPRLLAAGAAVRVLSRQGGEGRDDGAAEAEGIAVEFATGDLASGAGVDAALAGVTTVLHCAGSAEGDEAKARTLALAAARAGVRHLVYISVVGAERIPVVSGVDRRMFGYFAAKRAAELVVEESGVPWTTLRATQFHDLTLTVARALAKLPVIPVPAGFRFQTIETDEVAERLVELTLGEPAGLVADMGGPEALSTTELVRAYLRAVGRRRPTVPLRMPGGASRAIREGANLAPQHAVGRRTWDQFLADTVAGRH